MGAWDTLINDLREAENEIEYEHDNSDYRLYDVMKDIDEIVTEEHKAKRDFVCANNGLN